MSEIRYLDQSANNLKLSLVNGPVNESALKIVSEQRIALGGEAYLRAAIIGASHFVRFGVGPHSLTEVFACIPLETEDRIADCLPGEGFEWERTFHPSLSVRYSVRSSLRPYREGLPLLCELERRALAYPALGGIGLSYAFPCGPLPCEPKTVVTALCEKDVLSIQTAHAYPAEGLIAFTSSRFELNERGTE